MSTPNSNQQASQNLTDQLVNNTNAINGKVDELASALGGLSIGADVRRTIDRQLEEIKETMQGNNMNQEKSLKLKPLDHYDGVSRSLRSWLTEADLHMENKNIVQDGARVRFVGGHLKGKAWDWFEPFMRERGEKPKIEWSDRTTRVLGSYREMRKAMGQVFGDIDERKTAARKLQKLRQTHSVRNYITEFQTITANLDWDNEALADKFQEGLTPNIRSALIYFPTEPVNLEELFERAQKIDREQWSQRERQDYKTTKYFSKKNAITRDREGDVIMTSAKVSTENAKKQGLYFGCGRRGHQIRQCRQQQQKALNSSTYPSKDGSKVRMMRMEKTPTQDATIRMIRTSGIRSEKNHDLEAERNIENELGGEPLDVATLIQELSKHASSADGSDSDTKTEVIDYDKMDTQVEVTGNDPEIADRMKAWTWKKAPIGDMEVQENEVPSENNSRRREGLKGRLREPRKQIMKVHKLRNRWPELNAQGNPRRRQLDGRHSFLGIQEETSFSREESMADPILPPLSGESTEKRSEGTIMERLDAIDFSDQEIRTPVWKEYCLRRTTDTVKDYRDWYNKLYLINRFCNCYGFDPLCWGRTGMTWISHVKDCQQCMEWSKKECRVTGHSVTSKRMVLMDISERKFTPDRTPIRDINRSNCCDRNNCTHEFLEHGSFDVPWWACYEEQCAEHYSMKSKNGTWPKLPRVTIENSNKCPCLRKGCICGFSKEHHFHRGLLTVKQCWDGRCELHDAENTQVCELDQEVSIFRKEIRNAAIEIRGLAKNMASIRRTSGDESTKQMDTTILVDNEEVSAVIDSGADINYANEEWCLRNGIEYGITGYGKIKAYDGSFTQEQIREASIRFQLQGVQQEQTFQILKETGEDNVVLGMPWLESENPQIDWKERTVTIRRVSPEKSSSKDMEDDGKTSVHRFEGSKEEESKTRCRENQDTPKTTRDLISARRGGYETLWPIRSGRKSFFSDIRPHPESVQVDEYKRNLQEVRERLPEELEEFTEVFCKKK